MGKPGFPMLPPGGRVWEGAALKQGDGETGFPHAPARGRVCEAQPWSRGMGKPGFPIPPPGGSVWEGKALPGRTYVHPVGVRREPHGRLMGIEKCIGYARLAVGLMVLEQLIRYTGLAVGLKPSATGCEARLRGLERIMYSKTISPRLWNAKPACAGYAGCNA